MQTYRPIIPHKDMDNRDYELWRKVDAWNRQVAAALGAIGTGRTPDQAQTPIVETPPNITDHGDLTGLVPVLNPDGTVSDYNDDHTQYPLIFGRPSGQYIYGSRAGAATTWQPQGTFMLAANKDLGFVGVSSWAAGFCDANAPVSTGIVLVLATDSNSGLAGGETNYHTALADSGGNTWTKLKEFSYNHGPTEHVSLWFCLTTSGLTAGVSTITATFSSAVHLRFALEAYAFTMAAGLTVTLVDYATNGSDITTPASAPSLTLPSGAVPFVGETLFVRALSAQPSSGAYATTYTPTSGFTAFASDHTDSTNNNTGLLTFSQFGRGEFRILVGTGTSSAPYFDPQADTYSCASIFGGIQISGTSVGSLTLGAANQSDAGKIFLENRDVRLAAGLSSGKFKFDPLGSGGFLGILDFDAMASSDKTFTFPNTSGTIALTSDLAAYLKLDASNDPLTGTLDTQIIRPSADNAYDIGDATRFYKDLYLGSDIIPKTDGVLDIGTVAIGISQEHYAYPSGTGTQRAATKGMLWEDATLGDVIVGADGLFGSLGYYGQSTTKANSSATDTTEMATNFYQGSWGSGATPTYPFVDINYRIGNGTGKYNSWGLAADNALMRDGAVIIGSYLTSATVGGGGLAIWSRQDKSGAYLYFDETNHWMLFRLMSGGTMAAAQMNGFMFGGTHCNVVGPYVTNSVDLGTTTGPREWRHIYYAGTLTSSIAGTAISLASGGNIVLSTTTGTKIGTGTTQLLGFWNAAPIVQPTNAIAAATRVGGGGAAVTDTDTFDGYTIAQITKALRNMGLLA